MTFTLPFPPSVNHYWVANGKRRFISHAGRKFRRDAFYAIKTTRPKALTGDVAVSIVLYPPDKRRRDIDNSLKAVLDVLQYSGVIKDDCQVSLLTVQRGAVKNGGECVVTVCPQMRED